MCSNGNFPLRAALLGGDGECIQLLLEQGRADVDLESSRGTALTAACSEGDVEGVQLLLVRTARHNLHVSAGILLARGWLLRGGPHA